MIGRYESGRSPLDRGPAAARVIPYGRVPFVPGAALVVSRHLRFDETMRTAARTSSSCWRAPYVRYEPASQVAHAHRTTPRAWLARRVYYGRTAAPIAKRHPGNARPLHVSPWTTAAWAALATKRPKTALAITATASACSPREACRRRPPPSSPASARCAPAGLRRRAAPLLLAARVRSEAATLFAAAAITHPLKLADDLAYGAGLWIGCLQHRTLEPLLPVRGWRLERHTARRGRHRTARDGTPLQMGRHRGLGRRRPRRVPVPVQAPGARLRRERRVREPRRRVDAGRRIIEQRFNGGSDTTAVVLYSRDGPFTPQDAERVAPDGAKLCDAQVPDSSA